MAVFLNMPGPKYCEYMEVLQSQILLINGVFKWGPFSPSFFPVLCCVSTLIVIQLSWDSNRFLIRKNWFFASEGIHWWSYTKGDQWKIRSRELIILKVIYRMITCTLQWRHKRINNPRTVFYQVHPKAIQEGNIRVMSKNTMVKKRIFSLGIRMRQNLRRILRRMNSGMFVCNLDSDSTGENQFYSISDMDCSFMVKR